jgi:hypothetical protein
MVDFLLKLHAQGLSHEAVIEIMVALLGVMIAVLTLISGLLTAVIAVVGFFGYTTIRDEASRRATQVADETATRVALQATEGVKNEMWAQIQASGMSESQSEPTTGLVDRIEASAAVPIARVKKARRKATSDRNLKESGK